MFDKIIFLYWLTYECCQTFECGAVVQLMLSSNMLGLSNSFSSNISAILIKLYFTNHLSV